MIKYNIIILEDWFREVLRDGKGCFYIDYETMSISITCKRIKIEPIKKILLNIDRITELIENGLIFPGPREIRHPLRYEFF